MRKTGILALGSLIALALPAGAMAGPAAGAMAGPVMLSADLDGASETRGGDADGSGRFSGEIDAASGDVCYILTGVDIGKVTAAHIHKGAAGSNGRSVITLEVTNEDDDSCLAAEPDVLEPIVLEPGRYYVNIHTADYPKGAIRGQLAKVED
ncbi:MAG: CHRD domain-containing protein [Sphingomonadaceae bacterium]|nr:CHRD domain-containing protein [Sphingomonadaceae bacterium]